ncbi:MAG TPA: polyprenyl synthetase family protein [Chloroflexota bacterium]|nr:polyprenyl synthetase family protein [Chloroflexota bacterium]
MASASLDAALDAARRRHLPSLEAALQAFLSRPQVTSPEHLLGTAAQPEGPEPGPAGAHYGMMRYHLGWLNEQLAPASAPTGKRLRPLLCLLSAEACGDDTGRAQPVAVALELLHNFSLIHDDIEDHDSVRHHRPTVWALWGQAQGINAGDGMHVLSYLALLPLVELGVPAQTVLRLLESLAETSLIITEGQHLDLAFERREDVSPAEYLDMIGRKSAALLSCAAASGAIVAGAGQPQVAALAQYGHQLGMGFQIRDDILGIWGAAETTGKPAGDLYRHKKTLPSLYALSRTEGEDRAALRHLFATERPEAEDVSSALAALERTGARRHCEQLVPRYSAAAREHLEPLPESEARQALLALTYQLDSRES